MISPFLTVNTHKLSISSVINFTNPPRTKHVVWRATHKSRRWAWENSSEIPKFQTIIRCDLTWPTETAAFSRKAHGERTSLKPRITNDKCELCATTWKELKNHGEFSWIFNIWLWVKNWVPNRYPKIAAWGWLYQKPYGDNRCRHPFPSHETPTVMPMKKLAIWVYSPVVTIM